MPAFIPPALGYLATTQGGRYLGSKGIQQLGKYTLNPAYRTGAPVVADPYMAAMPYMIGGIMSSPVVAWEVMRQDQANRKALAAGQRFSGEVAQNVSQLNPEQQAAIASVSGNRSEQLQTPQFNSFAEYMAAQGR